MLRGELGVHEKPVASREASLETVAEELGRNVVHRRQSSDFTTHDHEK